MAICLGERDPYAMLEEMDSRLLARWEDYFAVEPFGPGVQAMQLGRLTAIQAAIATGKTQPLADFVPGLRRDDDDDSDDSDDAGDLGDDDTDEA